MAVEPVEPVVLEVQSAAELREVSLAFERAAQRQQRKLWPAVEMEVLRAEVQVEMEEASVAVSEEDLQVQTAVVELLRT
ncbi:MAG: hypothetical protein ABIG66_04400 [Candidatus Kerfeldbacteria bacterium]